MKIDSLIKYTNVQSLMHVRSLVVCGNEFNKSGMEFKDRSWFLTCFTRGPAKEVNLFLEETCA